MKQKYSEKNSPATKNDIDVVAQDIKHLDKIIHHDLETWGGNLAAQIDDVRQELGKQGEKLDKHEHVLEKLVGTVNKLSETVSDLTSTVQEVKKSVDVNSDSMSSLTKELREVKRVEFQVENHERRIAKLEAR